MKLLEKIFTVEPFNDGGGQPPDGVGTKLTITEAPTSIYSDEKCTVKGKIDMVDTPGGVVKSATVKLSYNGRTIGTATTDLLGIFIKSWTFHEAGIFYVIAKFEGVEGIFNPSADNVRIEVTEREPPTPPPGEGNAQIIEIDLPETLNPEDEINGLIRVKNTGDTDKIRLTITREWLGTTTKHTIELKKDYVMRITISHTMPEEDAKYTFKAQHKEGLFFKTDDTATYTITLKEAPPDDEEPPEEEKTLWEQIVEAWNNLEGYQKALVAGSFIGATAIIAKPYIKR